ncbi:hypothetical protein BFJ63_vAg10013 [Fusarium oxysporum f. sp. narcissi]|nr:hypothetical protein BFJ65_g16363 [Fusarium oxysporum f. sp. cepae]RKK45368.1 hypothetical protein BFJ66_g9134 [Fusarium oxysporum f. sp. cepae]RKK45385.1 hypothetical protein BFJ67_g8672 [Fusarium oxysporum f. sp. cepae]RYC87204.1 hypothetical protein BFJ63_vAg10013 [Fusarium oxysporum f. sp. narcissi]
MATSSLCVNNLSRDTSDDTLEEVFSEFGEVLNAHVMRDRDTGRSRMFGIVTFSNAEEAELALSKMNNQELDGRRLMMQYHNVRR